MRLHFVEPLDGQSRCYAFKLEVKSRACLSKQVMACIALDRESHIFFLTCNCSYLPIKLLVEDKITLLD